MRGYLLFTESTWLQHKVAKKLPHLIDSVLLITGIYLVFQWPQAALLHWLPYKITALLIYIGLGMVALRFGKTPTQKRSAWLGAFLTAVYILGVAATKQASSWLALV